MTRVKAAKILKLKGFVQAFGKDIFKTDGDIIVCKICEKSITADRKSQIQQHVNTDAHQSKLNCLITSGKNQLFLSECDISDSSKKFNLDLTEAFVAADISLCKIDNSILKGFLTKYTNRTIPSESALRKSYLRQCYENSMSKIKEKVVGRKLWVSIDETTDSCGRKIANCVVGILSENMKECNSYLINTSVLCSTNANTIAKFFDESINIFGLRILHKEDILLFVTDAAPYMIKAANGLTILYPKLMHITCLAHALHRVSEEIRRHFPNVDSLIANCKKIFLKAPTRIKKFKEIAPAIPLPPKPSIIRWGTWLSSAMYYCVNFDIIRDIILELDEDEVISIGKCKDLIESENIRSDLTYIYSSYDFLPLLIKRLEQRNLHLSESIAMYENTQMNLENAKGNIANAISQKFDTIMKRNINFKNLQCIAKCLDGSEKMLAENISNLSNREITCFKFAPVTSCDVERSFSKYKNMLRPNRYQIKDENLHLYTIPYCNVFVE